MAPVWIVLLAVTAMMVLTWLISLARRDASVVDLVWGLGFVLAAWLYHELTPSRHPRGTLQAGLVTLWGVRLSGHLMLRNWRKAEDYRYRAMRDAWGGSFAWVSLFTVFLFQGLLIWIVSLPFWVTQRADQPTGWTVFDLAGVVAFTVGLVFEAAGDWQLSRFRANPENRGKVLDTGLWRYTRHPNYFGDALVWWGFFLIALATPVSLWTIVSPLLMTFLLVRISGVPLLEKKLAETRPGYREYVERTSGFLPWPPR